MHILVTGAAGFIGRNLLTVLQGRSGWTADSFDADDEPDSLVGRVRKADFVIHLAGVNRPLGEEEYQKVNAGLTEKLLGLLEDDRRAIPFVLSSSTQAELDNAYGRSKRMAEEAAFAYGSRSGAPVHVYRFPNVFGKWSCPNYNSAVATFCHNIARGLPVTVNDPAALLTLVHIDDLVAELVRALAGQPTTHGEFCRVPETYQTTVGDLVETIRSFASARHDLAIPDLKDPLVRKLYGTYQSFLPSAGFSYPLAMKRDARGSFTEFLRTPERGQVSVNISRPGITKGNHWHHTKCEKFLVVSGRGEIRFRQVGKREVISYEVCGEELQVVDIPPGYTHSIVNTGNSDLVTVMWASESFDPSRPDTIFEEV